MYNKTIKERYMKGNKKMKYCHIDKNGNTKFVKTEEALKLAIKNGYTRECFIRKFGKWEKI